METLPIPLDALASPGDGLDDFRVSSRREIALMLNQLCDGSVRLQLYGQEGTAYSTVLWTVDVQRGTIGFNAESEHPAVTALLRHPQVVAVGYLDKVKLQFDLHNLVLVRGNRASVLSGAFPHEIFRFQRRNAFRVRPLMRGSRLAKMRHAAFGPSELALRILDVSIGGCAVLLPDDMPAPPLGLVVADVQIDLDADTRFAVNMRLQHVTLAASDSGGARLGFEFVRAPGEALRALQQFIDQTQKRSRLMSLG